MLDLSNVLAPKEGRDIELITADILEAKRVGGEAILTIGRCLTEAKAKLSHGEWLPWLTEKVEFSESTAQRFMRLAREWSNPSALTDLGAAKALSLLALPPEERDSFLADTHEVDGQEKTVVDMTSRELEKAIRERKDALEAAEKAKANARSAEDARIKMAEDLAMANELLERAKQDQEMAAARAQDLADELSALKANPVDVAVMEVDQAKLDEAKAQAVAELQAKLDKAKLDKTKAEDKRKSAEADRDLYQAKVEELEKKLKQAAITADKDVATFQVLFQQAQETVNKMQGLLLKARGREDQSTAQSITKAMLALADAVKGATA